MDEQQPFRIVVELVSSAEVKRLEGRDENLGNEIKRLENKLEGLHRTIYEVMEAISKLKSKR